VEHPEPLRYILTSDEWREWPMGGPWTIAPLYHVFLAALLAVSGSSLLFVLVVQCVLDALVAVAVAALGARAAGGPRGSVAGVAYALYFPAVQLCNSTMTEALHTPLLALAFVLLSRAVPDAFAPGERPVIAPRAAFAAGLAFGVGALARTVGLAYVPVAALLLARIGRPRAWRAAGAFVLAAALPIVPWAARNRVVMGDPSPIESASVANLLIDNVYVDGERYDRLEHWVFKEKAPAARRDRAMEFVRQGLARRAHLVPNKVARNVRHFLRPEGLWVLLGVQQPWPAWRHLVNVGFDDLWLVVAVPLAAAWLAGARGPWRALMALWIGLYLFLILVVFHSEIRYRMPIAPYVLACAAGGLGVLARRPRARAAWAALAAGAAVVSVVSLGPFAGRVARGVSAWAKLQPAGDALRRGDLAGADRAAAAAAAADPTSTWPHVRYGRWLAASGRPAEALASYARAVPLREVTWEPVAVRPRLLADAGDPAAEAANGEAHRLSHAVDPWVPLEVAWRALPPPVADEIVLARNDYGAVRDFLHPRKDHRWSRACGQLRLRPATAARRYDVEIEMGLPSPAAPESAAVEVTIDGEGPRGVTVGRDWQPHVFAVGAPEDGVLDVGLCAPAWSRAGQPAAQGVAVRALRLRPLAE
jgi:4-amino-4-deoxy-L-arabinose transferase-like glycosyltransferase